jgi:tetratricopeptide (TPR) repeat protein
MVLLLSVCKGEAQLRSTPQAKSPDEFDAYLVVLSKKAPAEVISAGKEFASAWPHSELLAEVYQLEMDAYRSLNDPSGSIQAGQKALQVAPDNVTVMANLAYILADGTTGKQQLDLAENYARKALAILKTFKVPKRITPEEWKAIRRHVESEVHAALGLIAYKNNDSSSAIREFETSISLAPTPSPTQYYRLGLLYEATGEKTKAIGMFEQAAQLNDPAIRHLAESHLQALQH